MSILGTYGNFFTRWKLRSYTGCFGVYVCLLSNSLMAELREIRDEQLSTITGQAFISVDKTHYESYAYTRINLGLDVETLLGADKIELGRYDRIDARTGELERAPADIMLENFALGHIYSEAFYRENPAILKPVKEDGTSYQEGELVPFRLLNPFMEFATNESVGSPEIAGIRLGFEGAEGLFSADIEALSGNVDVSIRGTVNNLRDALRQNGVSGCIFCTDVGRLIVQYGGIIGGTKVGSEAALVYPDIAGNGQVHGEVDAVRATHIGITNGTSFNLNILGGINFKANDCSVLGIEVCFPLSQYRSFDISKKENGQRVGMASGLFISAQTENMPWQKDLKQNFNASNIVDTTSGFFLNVPTGGIEIDFVNAINGISRARTEYIDRGVGLF